MESAMSVNPIAPGSRRKRDSTSHQRDDTCQPHAALFPANSNLHVPVHVIRASKTRHGPRWRWGPSQHVQAAIAAIYPTLPKSLNVNRLTRQVNEYLSKDPEWC